MSTKIKLLTGIECGINELTGKHQRILTQQDDRGIHEHLDEILVDVVDYIGNIKVVTHEHILNLLQCDRKQILTEARRIATVGTEYEKAFKYVFQYKSQNTGKNSEYPFEVPLKGGFPQTTVKIKSDKNLVDANYTDYSQVKKEIETVLPRSKKNVIINMLDGHGEAAAAVKKKKETSSHTPLEIRRAREMVKTTNGVTPILLNLDNLAIVDIEHLRKIIRKYEGRVDTEVKFPHPEIDGKMEIFDALGSESFFYFANSL